MSLTRKTLIFGLGLWLAMVAAATPAFALWPVDRLLGDNDAQDEEYLPPPARAVEEQCEPIRKKVIELNRASKWVHPFLRPRIGWLKRKYEKCRDKYREQERQYLKHVELSRPEPTRKANRSSAPQLPPLTPPRRR